MKKAPTAEASNTDVIDAPKQCTPARPPVATAAVVNDRTRCASSPIPDTIPRQRKSEDPPELRLRVAVRTDIEDIVDVDLQAFGSVYQGYDQDAESLRKELIAKFTGRFDKVGGDWMPVLTLNEKIVGFLTACPTNRNPQDFTTWEEMCDEGTLNSTYDKNGKNIYIVTLSLLPRATQKRAQNMLFAHTLGLLIKKDIDQAFFESRLPGLRSWVGRQCATQDRNVGDLTEEEQHEFAKTYLGLTKTIGGKQIPFDRLLQIYHSAGCKFTKLIPNAYRDDPSMNFGVLCVFYNPLPGWLRYFPPARIIAGGFMLAAARIPWLARKTF